ncbi:MAG: response regulator transcription factor [Phycisphaerae bacterium]|nr:response regulator transcription factor [Phycisphaerae bacterium]
MTPSADSEAAVSRSDAIVYVVDDDPAVRSSICWLLESVSLPFAAFGSGQAFLEAYQPDRPSCLVLDVRMPGLSGIELQERLNSEGICLPIVFISGHGDVPIAVRAMRHGAIDFIEKPFDDKLLLERIESSLESSRAFIDAERTRSVIRERMHRLSPRENDVMWLVAAGLANKAIAARLGLSPKTVEVHRARVMDKMEANSLADLVRMCLSNDLRAMPQPMPRPSGVGDRTAWNRPGG